MSSSALAVGLRGSVWLDKGKYEEAEGRYQQTLVSCVAEAEVPTDVRHWYTHWAS